MGQLWGRGVGVWVGVWVCVCVCVGVVQGRGGCMRVVERIV